MKNTFLYEYFQFLEMKFSIYLNRCVFVMINAEWTLLPNFLGHIHFIPNEWMSGHFYHNIFIGIRVTPRSVPQCPFYGTQCITGLTKGQTILTSELWYKCI